MMLNQKKYLSEEIIQILVFILVFTIFFPESKIGFTGVTLIIPYQYYGSPLNKPYIFEIIIILILISFFIGLIQGKIHWKKTKPVIYVIWLLYLSLLLLPITVLSGFKLNHLDYFRIIFESLCLFVVVNHVTWEENDIRKIINVFIFAAFFNGLVALIGFLEIFILPWQQNIIEVTGRYAGLFSQPSRLSLLISMAFIMLLAKLFNQRRLSIITFLHFLVLLVFVVVLALAQNRGPAIAILIVFPFALYLFFENIGRNSFLLTVLVAFGAVLLKKNNLFYVYYSRFLLPEVVHSYSVFQPIYELLKAARYSRWAGGLRVMVKYPFGVGYTFLPEVGHAHSDLLNWGAMFGIVGLLFLILFIVTYFVQVANFIKHTFDGNNELKIILLGISVFLLAGFFEPFLIMPIAFWFWLFTGISLSYTYSSINAVSC